MNSSSNSTNRNSISSSSGSSSQSIDAVARSVVIEVISVFLKQFMSTMSTFVPSQDIVRCLTQNHHSGIGTRFIEFKDVLSNMMDSYTFDILLYNLYIRINTKDILQLRDTRIKHAVSMTI
jgi:hypothetical protein